eukprot:5095649-Pyramimonas_sp.AAC.1
MVCRRVFEHTRALCSGRVETCAHPVHRPMYRPMVGCAQPVIGLCTAGRPAYDRAMHSLLTGLASAYRQVFSGPVRLVRHRPVHRLCTGLS